jgi:dienelactone hydrolase
MLTWVVQAQAAVQTTPVPYHHGEVLLEGILAYDDAMQERRPGVLVVHEWKGLGDYAQRRAEQLARLGYVAFAVDMYGKGVRARDHNEAASLAGIYKSDRQLMRGRINAALEVLRQQPFVDAQRIAAIGYCFGGTTVLELARSGADIAGVASFHGALDTPHPEDAKQIRAKVLVLQGGADPYVSPEQVAAFEQEMQQAGRTYRLIAYEGAVHSFTVPESGADPSKGVAYNPEADQRSWDEMLSFFKEIFHLSEMEHLS